jgi:uncharacterized protein YyaL (SSP411 family)
MALYQTDFDLRWFQATLHQADEILNHFPDPQGGFFDTRDDHEALILRPKSVQDTPTPSGNSLAITLLLHLAAFTGESGYIEPADSALRAFQRDAVRHPTAFPAWLCALDFGLGPQHQLALIGQPDDPDFQALAQVAADRFLPRLVVAGGPAGAPGAPPLLADREPVDDKATAYLCQGFACKLPVTSPKRLKEQLEASL